MFCPVIKDKCKEEEYMFWIKFDRKDPHYNCAYVQAQHNLGSIVPS